MESDRLQRYKCNRLQWLIKVAEIWEQAWFSFSAIIDYINQTMYRMILKSCYHGNYCNTEILNITPSIFLDILGDYSGHSDGTYVVIYST